jgi:hypothetical protein
MYVTLGSQIRDDLDECEIKEKYGLTWKEVDAIVTKAASALSNLIKTKAINTIYQTTCLLVLNLYFGRSIDVSGAKFADKIQDEIVRNVYAKNQEKIDKENKMIIEADYKQKQITSLGSNTGCQTYKIKYF